MDIFGDITAEEYFALLDELRDEMVRAIKKIHAGGKYFRPRF